MLFRTDKNDWLALLAGVGYTLAFAPFNYSLLIFFAVACFFYLCQHSTPKRALWRGYLFGVGKFGLGVSWVYVSLHDFGHVGIVASTLMTTLFCGFWAIFPAITGYLCAKWAKGNVFTMMMLWLLVDYVRATWVLDGFPWLLPAYSQLDSPLAGYVPLLGVYGTGLMTVLTAALLLYGVQQPAKRLWMMVSLIILWSTGAYLTTQTWTHAIGKPISVALIQGNISQDKKWLPQYKQQTLQLYQHLTEQHWGTNVIIWPETSIPAYLSEVNDRFLMPLHQSAQQQHTDLVVSLPIKNDVTGQKYNAVMSLGQTIVDYRKQHLLPFGETLPWQPLSGFVLRQLGLKFGNFTAGSAQQSLLTAGGYAFITSICYEDVFGHLALQGIEQAAYLVNVTNDGWFGNTIEPHQHAQLARMRALETGRYLLRATNTGLTAIIAPNGKIIKQLPLFETAVLQDNIVPMGGLTPYAKLGDTPILLGLLILGLGSLIIAHYQGNGYDRF